MSRDMGGFLDFGSAQERQQEKGGGYAKRLRKWVRRGGVERQGKARKMQHSAAVLLQSNCTMCSL